MTPIESTFSLDVNSKLDWEAMGKILARGHSRVPVYSGNPKNVIGLLLVKSLLTVRPETETLVSAVCIRRIPRVPADMPLYDILNEFQKGSSHMAAVVKVKGKSKVPPSTLLEEHTDESNDSDLTAPLLLKREGNHDNVIVTIDKANGQSFFQNNESGPHGFSHTSEAIEDGEVIGIITLEDVFEELLQEEIVDETDEYVDVHKRIRVAAAAAASSIARAPSSRKLLAQKGTGGQNKQGQTNKVPGQEQDKMLGTITEPIRRNN
jgi:metal transporter CNNM